MKRAVVLFNLGGPDKLENVQPFLFNLFNDPAIIGLPEFLRKPLAKFIAKKRAVKAAEIYKKIGGRSPILPETEAQAAALQADLGDEYKVFICMRYWHPMSNEVAAAVKAYAPDEIILLPLYPQFSSTTTGSSFKDFLQYEFLAPARKIESYHLHPDFIAAHVELIRPQIEAFPNARVLFSAHGLPKKVIKAGDPYQKQIEETSAAIAENLGLKDWLVCYQSKVGPLPWLKPNTADEIAGAAGRDLIIVPISFVSEHSETLVELDIDFKKLANEIGVKNYIRIPALGAKPQFIRTLASLARKNQFSA